MGKITQGMIHEAYTKGVVAERYYSLTGKAYNREQARKQFAQDRAIDKKILVQVFKEILNEQKALL